ncbi:MAG: NepR family anti-sigma factor [Litorimonas sp.]
MTKNPIPSEDRLETSPDHFSNKPLTEKIGNNLQQLYNEVVNEDIPDDFLSLLAKADK